MIDYCIDYLVSLFDKLLDFLSGMELLPGVSLLGVLLAGVVVVLLITFVFNFRK